MIKLAWRNVWRRPIRNGLALAGLAAAVAVLGALSALAHGYRQALGQELTRMGMQLMLVPLGCPYDAAARVLKGRGLDYSLPASALATVRADPDVAVAAPLLMVSVSREREQRADVWVGLDPAARLLKPWWHAESGADWFPDRDSVILGFEAAEVEMRVPGDRFFSPEANRTLTVAGVLRRSGTSDDSLMFVPLATAQEMFDQRGRLTAIAVRLQDPSKLQDAATRLQAIPGAQVVTLTEMMGTFLSLVSSIRTLSRAVGIVALAVSILSVFNTLLAAVVERAPELSLMRAVGASRSQVFGLVALESFLLTSVGSCIGLALVWAAGPAVESMARRFVPFPPERAMIILTGGAIWQCLAVGVLVGLVAAVYPAWRATLVQPAVALREV